MPGVEDKLQNLAASEMWSVLTTNLQSFSKHPQGIYWGPQGLHSQERRIPLYRRKSLGPARQGWEGAPKPVPFPSPGALAGCDTCRFCSVGGAWASGSLLH